MKKKEGTLRAGFSQSYRIDEISKKRKDLNSLRQSILVWCGAVATRPICKASHSLVNADLETCKMYWERAYGDTSGLVWLVVTE